MRGVLPTSVEKFQHLTHFSPGALLTPTVKSSNSVFTEAFSGSSVAVQRELDLDPARINVNGGSVALGHPIGASGCRVLITLLHEMKRADKKVGMASLCLGGGEAVAMIIKR